jgi:hypothetical protein
MQCALEDSDEIKDIWKNYNDGISLKVRKKFSFADTAVILLKILLGLCD